MRTPEQIRELIMRENPDKVKLSDSEIQAYLDIVPANFSYMGKLALASVGLASYTNPLIIKLSHE